MSPVATPFVIRCAPTPAKSEPPLMPTSSAETCVVDESPFDMTKS